MCVHWEMFIDSLLRTSVCVCVRAGLGLITRGTRAKTGYVL